MEFMEAVNEAIDILTDQIAETRYEEEKGFLLPEDAQERIVRLRDVIEGLRK